MSVRIASSSLISGAVLIGRRGHGVLGSEVPSTGTSGAGYLYNDLSLPADAAKEVRGTIESGPSGLTSFFAWEDSSFQAIGPDGAYSFTYRLYVDGADQGTATVSFSIGASSSTATAAAGVATASAAGASTAAATASAAAGAATVSGVGSSTTASGTASAVAAAGAATVSAAGASTAAATATAAAGVATVSAGTPVALADPAAHHLYTAPTEVRRLDPMESRTLTLTETRIWSAT